MFAKVLSLCLVSVVAADRFNVRGACDSYPCQNGYACKPLGNDEYTCGCPESMGKNCEHAHVKRQIDCSRLACPQNQVCVLETVYCKKAPCSPVAMCVKKDANICKHHPCMNGGLCRVTADHDYTCTCPAGFVGTYCEAKMDF